MTRDAKNRLAANVNNLNFYCDSFTYKYLIVLQCQNAKTWSTVKLLYTKLRRMPGYN